MPHDTLETLLDNLRKTHRVYSQLLDIAERKQTHILQNDTASLRLDLKDEETLSSEGSRLTSERDRIHEVCREELEADDTANTLESLSRYMPEAWHTPFNRERAALKDTLGRLQKVNRVNVALVNNSIELMDGLLSALFGTEPVAAYGPRGGRVKRAVRVHSLNASA